MIIIQELGMFGTLMRFVVMDTLWKFKIAIENGHRNSGFTH